MCSLSLCGDAVRSACRNVQVGTEVSLKSHFQYEKQCCTCAQLPPLFCPGGSLFPPVSISHAIQAGADSLLSVARCMQYMFVTQAVWGKMTWTVSELEWALRKTIGAY